MSTVTVELLANHFGIEGGKKSAVNVVGTYPAKQQSLVGSMGEGPAVKVLIVTPTCDLGMIFVASAPDGADVLVDGNFVGNTPANLKLPAGRHTVTVAANGYQQWSKELSILVGSESRLNATLQKQETNAEKH